MHIHYSCCQFWPKIIPYNGQTLFFTHMWFQKQMKRECVCNLHTDLGKMTMWVWPLTFKNMFAIFKCKKCEIMNTNQVFWKKHFNLCSGFHWIKVRVLKRTKNNRKIVDIFFNENIRFDIHCGSHFIRK